MQPSLNAEVKELQKLLEIAELPAVRQLLEDAVQRFSSASPGVASPVAPAAAVGMQPPVAAAVSASQPSTETKFEHTKWGWDSGDKFVSVYATVSSTPDTTTCLELMEKYAPNTLQVPGLKKGDKDKVKCDFSTSSFDLIVTDVDGKNFRLSKSNLEKDIKPEDSKVRVKDGKVVLLLAKVNNWDYWTNLVSKTKRKPAAAGAAGDGGIMDMMKEMYDSGDDNMKRVIGQAWEKSQKERLMGGGAASGGAAGMSGLGGGLDDEDLAF